MSERSKVEARSRSLYELLDRHLHSVEESAGIAELKAAAVSATRIESLYPGTLLDLAPRLEVLMNQRPIPPEATELHDALVELDARRWLITTLHTRHWQQVFHTAFTPERRGYIEIRGLRVGVTESMSLRLTLSLIVTLVAAAFEDAGQELPWTEINAFLRRADEPLHLAHLLLTAHPAAA